MQSRARNPPWLTNSKPNADTLSIRTSSSCITSEDASAQLEFAHDQAAQAALAAISCRNHRCNREVRTISSRLIASLLDLEGVRSRRQVLQRRDAERTNFKSDGTVIAVAAHRAEGRDFAVDDQIEIGSSFTDMLKRLNEGILWFK